MVALAPAAAGVSAGLTQASTLLGLVGTATQFVSNRAMYGYQAAVAERNAYVLEENARNERLVGQIEQQEQDQAAALIIGRERTRQGASGIDTSSTAFSRILTQANVLARRDAMRTRTDSDRRATSLENQAQGELETAENARRAGRFSALEAAFGIGDTLIGGATLVNRRRVAQLGRQSSSVSQAYA